MQARVNGGRSQDFVLDTGSEETVLSRETAQRERIRPVTYTLSAGVGEVGLRGLQLAQVKSLDFGTLQVRNLPVLIKNPALRGIPKREGESFSPLSIGMSMRIDYKQRLLTIGRQLPPVKPDVSLPMRINRLAMVRGLLNSTHPAYFVVDTGGEVISISSETASILPASPFRRIPLRVWGTSGWDREAFLMPGQNLDFDEIEYRNFPLVVLNLRAPSILLGFQLGGIVGHKFLAPFRVTMDMERSELLLERFQQKATKITKSTQDHEAGRATKDVGATKDRSSLVGRCVLAVALLSAQSPTDFGEQFAARARSTRTASTPRRSSRSSRRRVT